MPGQESATKNSNAAAAPAAAAMGVIGLSGAAIHYIALSRETTEAAGTGCTTNHALYKQPVPTGSATAPTSPEPLTATIRSCWIGRAAAGSADRVHGGNVERDPRGEKDVVGGEN